ncbi:MAG: extracellular solute-binding protein [Arcobacteraceae bacterium]|nr:extracellular solute-binding protein [Arcobacteraceae bacterium]
MLNSLFKSFMILSLFSGALFASTKPTMLFYCGITMVKSMQAVATEFEKKNNCSIKIIQGGSEDLYDSLKLAQKGDLYLPGSDSYLKDYKKDGYFEKQAYVGFNQAAIFVKKGNPKKIKNLDSLVDEKIGTTLASKDSGSIGKMTKKILIAYKDEAFYNKAFDMALEIGTDSRSLDASLAKPEVDMIVNWIAAGVSPEMKKLITIVPIDEKYAPKKSLVVTVLSFSQNKPLAEKFVDFASSKRGEEIMKKYGFR